MEHNDPRAEENQMAHRSETQDLQPDEDRRPDINNINGPVTTEVGPIETKEHP